jgi:hypothetical protein
MEEKQNNIEELVLIDGLDCITDKDVLEYGFFIHPVNDHYNKLYQESKYYNPFAKEEFKAV